MAVTDLSPPPTKQDPKFDNWMYRLWLRARASVDYGVLGATSPILTTTGTGTIGISHATSGVVAGTYGSASAIPVVGIDTYGHVVTATSTAFSVSGTGVTGADLSLTTPIIFGTGTGTNILLRSANISHATSGVIPGTYGSPTTIPVFVVNTYGHITSGTTTAVAASSIITQNIQNGNYTLVIGDVNKHIYREGTATGVATWTIPANASVPFDTGTPISFVNEGTGAVTLVITSDTLVFFGTGATGSRTLASSGWASTLKVASTRWAIAGVGLT